MKKADFDLRENMKLIEELRRCAENADIDMCKDCRWHTKDEVNCIDLLLLDAAKVIERTTKHLEFWLKKHGS